MVQHEWSVLTSLLLLRPGPGPQGPPLGPRWPCYLQQWNLGSGLFVLLSVPFVRLQRFLLTSDEKHICAQTMKTRQEVIWFLFREWNGGIIESIISSFFQVCANNQSNPSQIFLFVSSCRSVFLSTSVRCHPSSAYEKQITKTWFQSVWFLFHFLSDEFSYQRCEKQKVICSLELKFPGETVVTDDVSSRQIARRGRDLSMSQGSFYSCVQISVCIYFSRHWSLNPAPDLLSSFIDEHTTTVSVLILYTVLYIMLFFLPITRRPFDEKQRKKNNLSGIFLL